jgi:hypothetical protein
MGKALSNNIWRASVGSDDRSRLCAPSVLKIFLKIIYRKSFAQTAIAKVHTRAIARFCR